MSSSQFIYLVIKINYEGIVSLKETQCVKIYNLQKGLE